MCSPSAVLLAVASTLAFKYTQKLMTQRIYGYKNRCMLQYIIDGHVCCNIKHRLPFIICRPRKTNFRFPFSANKRKLSFFVSSVFRTHTYIYIYDAISNRKWKPRQFSFILLPFALCENRSSLFFRLYMKKQTKVISFQTN